MKTATTVSNNYRVNIANSINKDFNRDGSDNTMSCTTEGEEDEVLVIENERFLNNDFISKYVQGLNKGFVKQYFHVYGFNRIIFRSQLVSKSYSEFELEYSIY